MSLENTLERIAVALEQLVASQAGANTASKPAAKSKKATVPKPPAVPSESKVDASTADASTSTTPKVPTPPPVPQAAVPTVPPAVPSTSEATSPVIGAEEFNGLMVAEYNRLGGTPEVMQRIFSVMETECKVRSVHQLTFDQYEPLIAKIRAL